MSDTTKRKLSDLRVVDLKAELERRGLDKSGIKSILIGRLSEALVREGKSGDFLEGDLASMNRSTADTPNTTMDDSSKEPAGLDGDSSTVGGEAQTTEIHDGTDTTPDPSSDKTGNGTSQKEVETKVEPNENVEETETTRNSTEEKKSEEQDVKPVKDEVEEDESNLPENGQAEEQKEGTEDVEDSKDTKVAEEDGAGDEDADQDALRLTIGEDEEDVLDEENKDKLEEPAKSETEKEKSDDGRQSRKKSPPKASSSKSKSKSDKKAAQEDSQASSKSEDAEKSNGDAAAKDSTKADGKHKDDKGSRDKKSKGDRLKKSDRGPSEAHNRARVVRRPNRLIRNTPRVASKIMVDTRPIRLRRRSPSPPPRNHRRPPPPMGIRRPPVPFDRMREMRERDRLREQREREERQRLREKELRERREREAIVRQREIERRNAEQMELLERERQRLRLERERVEREKEELIRMERERQRAERERIEREKEEIRRAKLLEEKRKTSKRSFEVSRRSPSPRHDERKRYAVDSSSVHRPTFKEVEKSHRSGQERAHHHRRSKSRSISPGRNRSQAAHSSRDNRSKEWVEPKRDSFSRSVPVEPQKAYYDTVKGKRVDDTHETRIPRDRGVPIVPSTNIRSVSGTDYASRMDTSSSHRAGVDIAPKFRPDRYDTKGDAYGAKDDGWRTRTSYGTAAPSGSYSALSTPREVWYDRKQDYPAMDAGRSAYNDNSDRNRWVSGNVGGGTMATSSRNTFGSGSGHMISAPPPPAIGHSASHSNAYAPASGSNQLYDRYSSSGSYNPKSRYPASRY